MTRILKMDVEILAKGKLESSQSYCSYLAQWGESMLQEMELRERYAKSATHAAMHNVAENSYNLCKWLYETHVSMTVNVADPQWWGN